MPQGYGSYPCLSVSPTPLTASVYTRSRTKRAIVLNGHVGELITGRVLPPFNMAKSRGTVLCNAPAQVAVDAQGDSNCPHCIRNTNGWLASDGCIIITVNF